MEHISAFFSGGGIADLIACIIIVFYAVEGMHLGFILASLDLISFLSSFIIALKTYTLVAQVLLYLFAMPKGFAFALGFFLSALISEIAISNLLRFLYRRYGYAPQELSKVTKIEQYLGILPGAVSALIILAFLSSVIVSLPSSPYLKQQVMSSHIGGALVSTTAAFEKKINAIFGGALTDTLNFMTVEPQSDETVTLNFTVTNGSVDEQAEDSMLTMVNKERSRQGLSPLILDTKLRALAREYAQDMLSHGYFSHYNTENESPFDRMDKVEIRYGFAGENLALAPSTELAMQGLMNSQGHRENILKKEFRKVGIGTIDGGIYGKMFTQEFTD
ncbi:hypothetical protein BH11PAT1_BH11PAT1_7280 [soil metagenome]